MRNHTDGSVPACACGPATRNGGLGAAAMRPFAHCIQSVRPCRGRGRVSGSARSDGSMCGSSRPSWPSSTHRKTRAPDSSGSVASTSQSLAGGQAGRRSNGAYATSRRYWPARSKYTSSLPSAALDPPAQSRPRCTATATPLLPLPHYCHYHTTATPPPPPLPPLPPLLHATHCHPMPPTPPRLPPPCLKPSRRLNSQLARAPLPHLGTEAALPNPHAHGETCSQLAARLPPAHDEQCLPTLLQPVVNAPISPATTPLPSTCQPR